jgi:septum site-determining protein MinD
MGTVVVVTPGKGGVGKTTSTAALGAALAQAGEKVAVVDFDVGLRNLDLVMGAGAAWSSTRSTWFRR